MNRREKDKSQKTQSRGWYLKKDNWITSDEIEDEETNESIEEEESKEEEAPIRSISPVEGRNKVCPVCREEFSHFFEHGDGDQEEGWYLNNAMEYEGTVYHPECFKDKDNAMDNSLLIEDKKEVVPKQEPMSEGEFKSYEDKKIFPPVTIVNVKKESMEVTEAMIEPVSIKVENDAVKESPKDVNVLLESLTKFDWSGHGINIKF